MSKTGPIVIIEDDVDDESLMEEVIKDLEIKNKIKWFTNGPDALDYLRITDEQPFLIFCDINLPKQSGIEFKRTLHDDIELRKRSIPFVYYTTYVDQKMVNEAYFELTVQGFFQKKYNFEEIKKNIKLIIEYWMACRHPNSEV